MHPRHACPLLLGLLVVALIGLPVAAEEAQSDTSTEKDQKREPTREETREAADGVITNETLERLFGEAPEAPAKPASDTSADKTDPAPAAGERKPEGSQRAAKPATTDPLELMRERQAQEAERKRLVAEAEQKVVSARQRIADLEKRRLAIVNPFMARPEIPEDEKAQWNEEGSQARLLTTDQQLEQARQQLAEAESALAGLRSGA